MDKKPTKSIKSWYSWKSIYQHTRGGWTCPRESIYLYRNCSQTLDKYQTTFIQLFTLRVVEIASLPHSTLPLWACKWPTNFYVSRAPRMHESVWMSNIAWRTVRLVPWRRSAQGAPQWSIRPRENQKGPPSGNWCRRRIFQGHVFCHSPLYALVKALIHRKSGPMPK